MPGVVVPVPQFGLVYYVDPRNNEFIDSIIEDYYGRAKSNHERRLPPSDSLRDEFGRLIISAASFIKDNSFENEREYRLIVDSIFWRRDLLKFRTSRSSLIPYAPLQIPRSPSASRKIGEPDGLWNAIANITVGPTPNISLSLQAVGVLPSS
jgi:hypothetical protein